MLGPAGAKGKGRRCGGGSRRMVKAPSLGTVRARVHACTVGGSDCSRSVRLCVFVYMTAYKPVVCRAFPKFLKIMRKSCMLKISPPTTREQMGDESMRGKEGKKGMKGGDKETC